MLKRLHPDQVGRSSGLITLGHHHDELSFPGPNGFELLHQGSYCFLAFGYNTASAPQAMAVCTASMPLRRPITSTRKSRSWLDAVSRMRSMASTAVLSAVSNPSVRSVPGKSLSMVPGMPAHLIPWKRWSSSAP